MELRKANPRGIVVPKVRVTARFDDETYRQFRASIAQLGQLSPPLVYEVDGNLVLCDGWHRLEEAIGQGVTELDVVVLPGDMVDVLTKNILVDHTRGKVPVSEMVKVMGELTKSFGLDSDAICEKTGLTRDYVEKLQRIATASPVLLEALDEGWITVGVAHEIARLPAEVQQEEMIAKQRIYKFKVADLKGFVDQVLSAMEEIKTAPPAPQPTAQPVPRIYRCQGCDKKAEAQYLRPVMLCPECFGTAWRTRKVVEPKLEESEENTGGV